MPAPTHPAGWNSNASFPPYIFPQQGKLRLQTNHDCQNTSTWNVFCSLFTLTQFLWSTQVQPPGNRLLFSKDLQHRTNNCRYKPAVFRVCQTQANTKSLMDSVAFTPLISHKFESNSKSTFSNGHIYQRQGKRKSWAIFFITQWQKLWPAKPNSTNSCNWTVQAV